VTTPEFHVVPLTEDPEPWVFDAIAAHSAERARAVYGDPGLADGPRQYAAAFADHAYADHRWAIVVAAGDPRDVIAHATVELPRRDNVTTAEFWIDVAAAHRRRGIGAELLSWCEAMAAVAGRQVFQAWEEVPLWPDGTPLDHSPDGGPYPADSPGRRLARRRGYELAEVEYLALLDLPLDPARLAPLQAKAEARTAGYRLHLWTGDVPEEWRAAYATLMRRFTTDIPSGGLAVEEEAWDEARLADLLARAEAAGRVLQFAAAEAIATGELVALTNLMWIDEPGRPVVQDATCVLAAHRGHRLGLWVKLANLAELGRLRPDAPYIETVNAPENGPMRAINDALGFRVVGAAAAFQKRL
jgi:GNAT superfamily N-acetyltransferase